MNYSTWNKKPTFGKTFYNVQFSTHKTAFPAAAASSENWGRIITHVPSTNPRHVMEKVLEKLNKTKIGQLRIGLLSGFFGFKAKIIITQKSHTSTAKCVSKILNPYFEANLCLARSS